MAKRKRSSAVDVHAPPKTSIPILPEGYVPPPPPILGRRTSQRKQPQPLPAPVDTNPETNATIKDGPQALRASPDASGDDEKIDIEKIAPTKTTRKSKQPTTPKAKPKVEDSDSPLSDLPDEPAPTSANAPKSKPTAPAKTIDDPEADGLEEANEEELKEAVSRPPPVNSSYLPLPWKGRIGYACLCTYLRAAHVPVFSSRTCRIQSILDHRHPLLDPTQPEHATKNRPDKDKPAEVARGQAYVEGLGLANAQDIVKMLRWNEKYNIKFFRLSSEMFPFASHEEYGYKLAPFASEALAEAGRVAAEFGHRLTTHPGQFTQLGSPREKVVRDAVRDLEYHNELLSLLKLPEQANRDAVMILHMGGVFGDKEATLNRFRGNYARLSPAIKMRLVLENDDVSWTVHDLLPVCEELNIPMVLDYHHHNIMFDADKIREGTQDIQDLYPRIKATWTRKGITQKMHYSEPTPGAITGRQRRKHNPRVATLPPCDPTMDLMIEAKDKEQAVFELMRTFKLPGYDTFADIVPYTRNDENRPWKPPPKKKTPKKKAARKDDGEEEEQPQEEELKPPPIVPENEVSMGGPEGRVYWPPSMEEWLRPKKREVKKRDPDATPAKKKGKSLAEAVAELDAKEKAENQNQGTDNMPNGEAPQKKGKNSNAMAKARSKSTANKMTPVKRNVKSVPTPSTSDELDPEDEDEVMSDLSDASVEPPAKRRTAPAASRRPSGRNAKKAVSYAEDDD